MKRSTTESLDGLRYGSEKSVSLFSNNFARENLNL